jgi:hemerythrin
MGLKNIELPQVANALMNATHEEEMEIINELYDACLKEDGEKVEPLLEFLLAHAEDHMGFYHRSTFGRFKKKLTSSEKFRKAGNPLRKKLWRGGRL